ncbi:hypothetical protein GH714_039781 [Hevea brasiliensis]|uniref:Protein DETOXIFICATION n=1 Tax=Hevea brasiliensis TaxID=3981 RepID=A0A6A6KF11_HEVBR|nr:hypothetical protein GH714_039781 [Hevea brasiliensis]
MMDQGDDPSMEKKRTPACIFFKDFRLVLKLDELGVEIARIALPAALALTADPIASLVDTAFIGRIGPVELAAVGVSIALFNQVSRIAIFPLVSVTTSFVAEEDTIGKIENERRHIPSASSAVVIGAILGFIQAIFLISRAKPLLNFMGVGPVRFTHAKPCTAIFDIEVTCAPAVLLSLAMQGVFRGFKDTKTPLYATVAGDVTNIILDPLLMFVFRLGVSGAAIAHVISQYLISIILLWRLMEQVDLVPPSVRHLQFGFLLLMRVIAVTFCVTLSASLAARQGSTSMAAFQVCLQVWLTTSLLADGLAVAGQAILASAFAKRDYDKVTATASRILQDCRWLILGLGLSFGARLFTSDVNVLHMISIGIPAVCLKVVACDLQIQEILLRPINGRAYTIAEGDVGGANEEGDMAGTADGEPDKIFKAAVKSMAAA